MIFYKNIATARGKSTSTRLVCLIIFSAKIRVSGARTTNHIVL